METAKVYKIISENIASENKTAHQIATEFV